MLTQVVCIEPRALGLTDDSYAYINGEYGGRVNEQDRHRDNHAEVSLNAPVPLADYAPDWSERSGSTYRLQLRDA